MFDSHHYVLKDLSSLPSSGKFIDPYDNHEYRPLKNESLSDFLVRIDTIRSEKNHPSYTKDEFRHFVEFSLAETCSPEHLQSHFNQTATIPKFSQIYSLTRTLMAGKQLGHASYAERQSRASHCLSGCAYHQSRGGMGSKTQEIIQKFANLSEVEESHQEKQLGTCSMCGCGLKAKVRFNIVSTISATAPDNILKLLTSYQSKAFSVCWILKESFDDPALRKILRAKITQSSRPEMVKYFDEHFDSRLNLPATPSTPKDQVNG